MKRVILITVFERLVFGSGDWKAEMECVDSEGDRWILSICSDDPTKSVGILYDYYLNREQDWDILGYFIPENDQDFKNDIGC